MTLSITHLEDEGSTSPASRLTSSSTSPSAKRRRCAYTSARASCHAPGEKTFFFSLIGRNLCPPASRAQARRGDDTGYDRGRAPPRPIAASAPREAVSKQIGRAHV